MLAVLESAGAAPIAKMQTQIFLLTDDASSMTTPLARPKDTAFEKGMLYHDIVPV